MSAVMEEKIVMRYDDDPEVANPHFLDPGNIPVVTSDEGVHEEDRSKRALYGESLWYVATLFPGSA